MKKKRSVTTILLFAALFAGLSLLLYPTVSDCWNSFHQSRAIASYSQEVASLNRADYAATWKAAQAYNESLISQSGGSALSESRKQEYEELLNVSGIGVMGQIEIPCIDVSLPIYHGTDEAVLQVAAGHLEWSSLPVGGESSHCVLSGHRGLPSAKLFTNLDRLTEGDVFLVRVLNEVLTYEVDQILIVEPENIEPLQIVEGKDYCTLVTCTPYGINTHRLLVRGHRIENGQEAFAAHITADAIAVEPLTVVPILAIPLLLLCVALTLLGGSRKSKRNT